MADGNLQDAHVEPAGGDGVPPASIAEEYAHVSLPGTGNNDQSTAEGNEGTEGTAAGSPLGVGTAAAGPLAAR